MNASKISLWFWLTVAALVIGLLFQNWSMALMQSWNFGFALVMAHLFCNPDWSEGED